MVISIDDFDTAVEKSVTALKKGEMIIYPTDTLYGLGADARSENAVKGVRDAKVRDDGKPISIMCSGFPMINEYCEVSFENKMLLVEMLPGPYTAVLPVKKGLAKNLCGESVGVRVPKYFYLLNVIKKCGFPITGTSANISGESNPCSLEEVPGSIRKLASVIVDGGKCVHSTPSTVVDMTGEKPKVLRKGAGVFPLKKSDVDASFF